MRAYKVLYSPGAQKNLIEIHRYIAQAASPEIATNYTDAIVAYCATFSMFPERGTRRDDLMPGLRVTNYRGRTVIAFAIVENTVSILGIFWGGRDYSRALFDASV